MVQRNEAAIAKNNRLKILLSIFFVILLPACGGGSSGSNDESLSSSNTTDATSTTSSATTSSDETNDSSDSSDGADSTGTNEDPTDLTALILSSRSPDCGDYAGFYISSASDVNRGIGFSGSVEITASAESCGLISNSIPNHDFNDGSASFPNNTNEVDQDLVILRNAQIAETITELDQGSLDVILLNGAPVDMLSAGCWDGSKNVAVGCNADSDWLIDPLGSDGFLSADTHNGHTQPNGLYHYHGEPRALYDDNPGPEGSPVIGFAADGFPVYGPYFLDSDSGQIRKARSGYTLKEGTRPSGPGGIYDGFYNEDWEYTDAGDLDRCNGMTIDGQYGYFLTDNYPWIIKCFVGSPHFSFNK